MKLRSGLVLRSGEGRNPMRGIKKPNAASSTRTIRAQQVKSLITYSEDLEDILCEAGTSRPSRPSRARRSLKARQAAQTAKRAAKLGQPRRSRRIAELRARLGGMSNLRDCRVVDVGQQVDMGPLIDMGQVVEVQLDQAAGTDSDSRLKADRRAAKVGVPGGQQARRAATDTPGLTDDDFVGQTAAPLGALSALDSRTTPVAASAGAAAAGNLRDLDDEEKVVTAAVQARRQEGCRQRFWTNIKSALMRWVNFA